MKEMTGLSITHKSLAIDNEVEFAYYLNTLFSRFDKGNISDQGVTTIHSVWSRCLLQTGVVRIDAVVDQVRSTFKKLNHRKAIEPDNLNAFILNIFADELAPVWRPVFQSSEDTPVIPEVWKTSYIIPLPKKAGAEELGDYRSIAFTPIIMKSLEKIVVKQLLNSATRYLSDCI